MDNYLLDNNNNDDIHHQSNIVNCSSCNVEIVAIESFSKCFYQRYSEYPVFFMGTLRHACEEAFKPTQIAERRQVLVYIHNDNSLFSNIFSKTIFCSTILIDYLLDNYIVWAWDITHESNRNILNKIWEELFASQFFDDFSMKDCCLLIGIMRLFEDKTNELTTLKYQFKLLVKDDIVERNQLRIDREILLDELSIFKTKCDEHEKTLSFNFVETTNLCWEIILEITEYLSLNDAISAFSPAIIPLLNDSQLKFRLSDPSISLIALIHQKFQLKQIVSLQFDTNRSWSLIELNSLSMFKNITFITFLNVSYEKQINQYRSYFPNIICLRLYYNTEIDSKMIHRLDIEVWTNIKRLEIQTKGLICSDYDRYSLDILLQKTSRVEYFLLNIRDFFVSSMNQCFKHHQLCFLTTIMALIQNISQIRYIHLIINENDIEQLMDVGFLKGLMSKHGSLEKITLEVSKNVSQKEQLIQKASTIQTTLNDFQHSMKFQMKFF